jgi:N-methylhydantoinase B
VVTTSETDDESVTQRVDPVTASIIRHGLDAAADQMLVTLKRTAFSPIIYDVLDGGGALYDRHLRMLSQIQTLPMFVGSLDLCLEAVVEHYAASGGLHDGDVIVVNDPYLTGTHQWDVAVLVPGSWPLRGSRPTTSMSPPSRRSSATAPTSSRRE